ncbi:hypothetical protein Ccrd_013190 [Cynara cardunculus var. scolymus]|uniref:Uncharacterized protein n=1 Tax=Cynara cardunculus var. scolymus TaxID=59895 RepID=A0A103YG36_CYNCS|nr:hypothetical protein Ccrd_013190 [Cynara cardunculus var. scolymus]
MILHFFSPPPAYQSFHRLPSAGRSSCFVSVSAKP